MLKKSVKTNLVLSVLLPLAFQIYRYLDALWKTDHFILEKICFIQHCQKKKKKKKKKKKRRQQLVREMSDSSATVKTAIGTMSCTLVKY
jgi:hypothetical protein